MGCWTGRSLGLLLIFVLAVVGIFLVTNTNLFERGARQDPRFEDVGGTPAAATTEVEVPPGSGVSAFSRHSATIRPDGTVWSREPASTDALETVATMTKTHPSEYAA